MSISSEEVKKIAHLAKLQTDASKQAALADELSKILDLAESLQAADTDGLAPMAHPFDAKQRLRPDTITESDQHERYQALAPQVEEALYLVPQVIE